MSKAFTRENDDAPEPGIIRPPRSSLPPGVRNHVTPHGAQQWRLELERLTEVERLRRAAPEDGGERPRPDASGEDIHRLRQKLRSAVVTPPPPPGEDRVRFGASVTVRDHTGEVSHYRIVGVDEADPERGWISWISPLARALLNLQAGESTRLKTPVGEVQLEIRSIEYQRETR